MNRSSFYIAASVIGVLLLVSAFLGGVAFGQTVDWPSWFGTVPDPMESDVGKRVDEVRRMLDREALIPSSEESMTAGAIQGLLDSLDDPYATYLDATHFEYFNNQHEGEFFGIGITIADREGMVYVVSPIEGTPAAEAGLQSDDVIVSIDGESRERWDVDEVVTRVRGEAGTEVELGIRREGEDELLIFNIIRAQIDIPNVMTRMETDDVGYIRLMTFNQKSTESVAEAIEDLTAEGATSFVLDVRDNPGGLLSSAVELASLFIDDGVIVRVEERDRPPVEHRANSGVATGAPLVLLVNGHSASASEVLAGALQDYDRAQLVGEKTFGKGSVQTVEQLPFGGGIKFTIARYLTPQGHTINGEGVTPDVTVKMDPSLQAEEFEDIQLQAAVDLARASALQASR